MDSDNIIIFETSFSLLVHTKQNLKRLHCPFLVKDKNAVEFKVTKIASSKKHRISYLINSKWESYQKFEIQ
jgi:hypothetical protein